MEHPVYNYIATLAYKLYTLISNLSKLVLSVITAGKISDFP